MKTTKNFLTMVSILMLTLFCSAGAFASTINDADALAGYNQGKIIFDINLKDANALSLYLKVIQQTHEDLEKQQIKPDIILAFRGLAVTLVQQAGKADSTEQQELSGRIKAQISRLQSMGMKMEVCSVAVKLFQVSNDNLLPGMKVVGNTFVSLMGYQNQGYAIIPIM